MIEIYLKSIKNIFINKSRAILTFFSIAVGVCAVVVTINIADMGHMALNEEINSLGINGISLSSTDSDAPLSITELNEIRNLSYVRSAVPLMIETTDIYMNNDKKTVCLWGIDNEADKTISLKLLNGRFFNSGDIASESRVCIIDEKLAADSYSRVGKTIVIKSGIKNEKYKIIGIIKTGSGILQNVMGSYIPNFIYVPYSTVQNDFSENNFSQIIVDINDEYDSEKTADNIIRYISGNIKTKADYRINDLSKQKNDLDNVIIIFTIVLSAVGSISLIVAGINTMNIMLVIVKEKTREIGIKKALGARRKDIISEFIIITATISLIGCLSGIISGIIISYIIAWLFGLTLDLNIGIITLIIGFTVISGTAFGIYPAIKASELNPVDALRYF